MKIQEVDFGSWHRWKNRNLVENSEEPGIYALGKFEITTPEKADLLDRRIIYFGETCKSLKVR